LTEDTVFDDAAPQPEDAGLISPVPVEPVEYPFSFTGRTGEYFRIWIVNLALSIFTLGIFSAWARVRSERWFYGNTWVADAPFEYLADPLRILRGRAIAVLLLGVYVGTTQLLPLAQPVLVLLLFAGTPWLIVSGLRFRARYSAWRTVNFNFAGTVGDAAWNYAFVWILAAPTLGLIFPYIRRGQTRFIVEGHRFGGQPLSFGATTGQFYKTYLPGWLLMLVAGAAGFAAVAGVAAVGAPEPKMAGVYGGIGGVVAVYGAMFIAWTYITARITNLTYNTSTLAGHRFRSTVRARDLLALYLSNTLAVIASFGMLVPWAQVRMASYRARHLSLIAAGPPDHWQVADRTGRGAAGAETADVFDIDVSI
jgi:uncharacterized membrane protein YjgN (DUF898 family)